MTKRMEKIIDTYETKMDDEIWALERGFNSYEICQGRLLKISNDFSKMRLLMYQFNAITQNDFDETAGTECIVYHKYYCKALPYIKEA